MNISKKDAAKIIERSVDYDNKLFKYLKTNKAIVPNMYCGYSYNPLVDYKKILLVYGLDNIDEYCFLYTNCGEKVLAKRGININRLY
jgi:hypothetical protein